MSHSRRSRPLGIAALLAALALSVAPGASEMPRKGGALRIGMIGEPPTLDAKYQPVPLLVESHEVQDAGKRYVLKLRKGVKFHNGKELAAADVVASLNRWG